ncbi:MAG TPA: hypoxanthine phosphoribosyltransferase [Candidatus Polarisedimenticolia bacterium]|nr:hypoxanthine phosphoribosyltransferase [Candidatus Polarisedimenticolia bacterium]
MRGTPPGVGEVVFTAAQIRGRVARLARQISRDYAGQELLLVTVLRGGIFFVADLARRLEVPTTLDFLAIASYGSDSGAPAGSGAVRITKDLEESITGRHVLIVEDVVDTGLTLGYIHANLLRRGPASLRVCILFHRPHRRLIDLPIDYAGFELPDRFLVGYGLDWRQQYRHLPYVAALTAEKLMT